MKTLLQITLIIFISCSNVSSKAYASSGWSGDATVTGIFTLNETTAIVKLSSFSNPGGCSTNADGDIYINPTLQKTWFTVLLSAYMGAKTVSVFVHDACEEIWTGVSYAVVGHVRLK